MSVEKPITGLSLPLISGLPAARTLPPLTCAPPMNRLAARHVRKSCLKDISQSRPYDIAAQQEKYLFRSWTVLSFRAAFLTVRFGRR
jgi:hypothetical protein